MDEKICIGCKYSEAYTVLKCRVLSSAAPEPCEYISACPFVPSNGKDPAYIDLLRTIRMGLVKYLNTARGLWEAMALSDDLDGQYALDKEITALDNHERKLTVRLIRAMRREEEKKNHE